MNTAEIGEQARALHELRVACRQMARSEDLMRSVNRRLVSVFGKKEAKTILEKYQKTFSRAEQCGRHIPSGSAMFAVFNPDEI